MSAILVTVVLLERPGKGKLSYEFFYCEGRAGDTGMVCAADHRV